MAKSQSTPKRKSRRLSTLRRGVAQVRSLALAGVVLSLLAMGAIAGGGKQSAKPQSATTPPQGFSINTGYSRDNIARLIAQRKGISLEKAREWLAREEIRGGYRVLENIPLPPNTQIDYVDFTKQNPTKQTLLLSESSLSNSMPLTVALEQAAKKGRKARKNDRQQRNGGGSLSLARRGASNRNIKRSAAPSDFVNPFYGVPMGLPYFPTNSRHTATSGIFKVLVVAVQFPGWRDVNPTDATAGTIGAFVGHEASNREPHDSNCNDLGLQNPTWDQSHPVVDRFSGDGRLSDNDSIKTALFNLLLNRQTNPFSLSNYYENQTHGNVVLTGSIVADVQGWLGSGNVLAGGTFQPNNALIPGGDPQSGACHPFPANLQVVTWNVSSGTTVALKPLMLNPFIGGVYGPGVRLKPYCYYTSYHDRKQNDPYQLVMVSPDTGSPPNDAEPPPSPDPPDLNHRDRPPPYDHDGDDDTSTALMNAGVPVFNPILTGQEDRHTAFGMVRDVSQVVIDYLILPNRNTSGDPFLDEADFEFKGYDLFVVSTPQRQDGTAGSWSGYKVFAPIALPPLPAVAEYNGSENGVRDPEGRNTYNPDTGNPGAPAVTVPSLVIPASATLDALNPTPGGGLWTTAHLLGHAFGFVDLDDQAGFLSSGVSPYTFMANGRKTGGSSVGYGFLTDRTFIPPGFSYTPTSGPASIRLDPYHKIKAGWATPIIFDQARGDVQNVVLPEIESSQQTPIILLIPADFENTCPPLLDANPARRTAGTQLTLCDSRVTGYGPEYFLVENHNRNGSSFFNENTPSGLYVYHVDERFFPFPLNGNPFGRGNDDENNYFVGVIQADGLQELQRTTMEGLGAGQLTGDPFSAATRNNLNQFPIFVNTMSPTSRFNPSSLNDPRSPNDTWTVTSPIYGNRQIYKASLDTFVRLDNVSAAGPQMTLDVYVKPREVEIQPLSLVFLHSATAAANGSSLSVRYQTVGTLKKGNAPNSTPTPINVDFSNGPNGARNIANYRLESPRGTVISINSIVVSGTNTVTVTPATPLTPGNEYILTVQNLDALDVNNTAYPIRVPNEVRGHVDGFESQVGVKQSAMNVPLIRLDIQHTIRSTNSVTIDNMTVNEIGSSKIDSDVRQYKLWQDDGDGVFTPLTDTLLSSRPVVNQLSRFTALTMSINLGQRRLLFLSADVDDFSQTNPPVTFGAQFDNFQSIVPLVPGSVQEKDPITGNVHFPMTSGTPTIVPKIITVTSSSVAASKVGINTPDFPVLQLQARTELGTGRLTRLTVNLEGSASISPPADIGLLKLYDDVDGDGVIDAGEALLASANFTTLPTGVKQAVLSPLSINLTTTPRPLLLAVDVLDATIRRDFRLILPDFNFIGTTGGELENVNFPMASNFTTISSRLTFSGMNLATNNVNIGTNDFVVLGLSAQLDKTPPAPNNFEILDGFTVNLTGTASTTPPQDIGDLELYNDANNNNIIDTGEPRIATAPFISGQATFTGLNLQITTTSRSFLLAVDVAASAITARTFRLTIPDAASVNAPSVIILTSGFPITSNDVTIVNTMTVTGTNLATSSVGVGTADYPVLALTAMTNGGNALFDGLTVTLVGTAVSPDDVSGLKMYDDANGNRQIEGGESLVQTALFNTVGGVVQASFASLNLNVGAAGRSLILALDVSANATIGRTFRLNIPTAANVVVGAGTSVTPNAFPISSNPTTIGTALTLTGISRAEGNVSLGQTDFPVLSLFANVNQGNATINRLVVNLEGSATSPTDVGALKLYDDSDSNGAVDTGDTLLSTASFATLADGTVQATLNGGFNFNVTTLPKALLLTLDVAANANLNRTFRLVLPNASSVGLATAGVGVSASTFPIGSEQTTIGRRLTIVGTNRAVGNVIAGVSNFPVLSLTTKLDRGTGTISRIIATLTGTVTSQDIANVKLINDANNNGAKDSGEAELSTGVLSGSQVTFDNLNLSVMDSESSLLLVVDLTLGAVAGRTFRLSLADANSVTSPQAVVVSTFPIASGEVTIGSISGGTQGIPPVTFLAGLAMFSMPQDFGNTPADQIMQTTKIARYTPSLGRYELFPFSNPSGLQLGRGYFAFFDQQTTINAQGTQASTSARFPISVVKDWNLLGYPYPPTEAFANGINWNDPTITSTSAPNVGKTTLVQYTDQMGSQTVTMQTAVERNVMRPVLFTLNAARNGYTMTTVMEPYKAYWARCLVDSAVLLLSQQPIEAPPFPSLQAINRRESARRDPLYALLGSNFREGWSVQLTARAGQAEDAFNYVGVSSTALDGRDGVDVEKPPALLAVAPTVDLALLQADAHSASPNTARLAIDLRAPNRESYTWDFVVTTNQTNTPVTVMPDLSRLPKSYRAMLVDTQTGQKRYLRTAPGYTYHSGAGTARRFQLLVFKDDPNPLRVMGLQVLRNPAGGGARFSLILSRSASVRLQIHSPTGQAIADLPLGVRPGGVTTVMWDGKSQRGVTVARGAYLLVVNATDETDARTVQEVKTFTVQ